MATRSGGSRSTSAGTSRAGRLTFRLSQEDRRDLPQPVPRRPRSPTVSLGEYVMGGAAARGDKPALIDGPSGAVMTYAELAERVGRGRRRPEAGRRRRQGRRRRAAGAQLRRMGDRLPRGDPRSAQTVTPLAPGPDGRQRSRRQIATAERPAARSWRPALRDNVAGAGLEPCLCARRPAGGPRAAGARDRPRRRPRGAAVLERHHRALQGRDADPPQHRGEPASRSGRDATGSPTTTSDRACCRSSTSTADRWC